jgi:hypothetical protein
MTQRIVSSLYFYIGIPAFNRANLVHVLALEINERACEAFPNSVDLWLLRIELVNKTQTQSESVMAEDQLFQTALSKNGASFRLWSAYVEWIEKKWQDDVLKSDIVDDLLTVSKPIEYPFLV